jgi:hypothetical protein
MRATRALENPEVLIVCMNRAARRAAAVLSSADAEIEFVIEV